MNTDEYNDWQESLLLLPERTFFELMRLYLGEIKTPFNKQRLVKGLSGFISKAETQDIIVRSLDSLDVTVLTAIDILPITHRSALLLFLSSEASLQTRLVNMEERLLIYRVTYEDDYDMRERSYKINPLLYKALKPLLDPRQFFLPAETEQPQTAAPLCDDIILAGLYTFFLKESSVLKTNGRFKIKTEKKLKAIFQDSVPDIACLELLCSALQNLDLLIANEADLIPQQQRWEEFFKQNPFDRKMYVSVAVYGHIRRDILQLRAQFFADFLGSLDPRASYSDETLKRFFDFLFQKLFVETGGEISVFPNMYSSDEMTVINGMKALGLLVRAGEYWQLNTAVFSQETAEQPLIAAPSFEITVLPYTSFARIFPVLNCLEPVSILTTGRFEITKAACSRCFERHSTGAELIALLDEAVGGGLPQNIKASIAEWYIQCTAVGLYRGFVLTVAEDKRELFRQNAELQGIIYKELAEGVYLIKQMELEAVKTIIKSAGLGVTFYNNMGSNRYGAAALLSVEQRPSVFERFNSAATGAQRPHPGSRFKRDKSYREHIRALEAIVDAMPAAQYEKRLLKEKIAKKLIVTQEQLRGKPTESDVREVSGLDFLGKIHLAETVITERSFLEVSVDEPAGRRVITGIPIAIEKAGDDAMLQMQIPGKQRCEMISIARVMKMRTLQYSLFS